MAEAHNYGMFTLGDVIKKRRQELGWTQADLAREASVSVDTIVRVEKNRTTTTDTIHLIAVALRTTAPELNAALADPPPQVRGAPPSASERQERDLLEAFRRCDPTGRVAVLSFARYVCEQAEHAKKGA